ncbi:MAG: aconitase X catalytic domain-containing protein [Phycisphaerae bacterium]|jgi:predicted aconitase
MKLTDHEKATLAGDHGAPAARALDYLVQFGDAFGAERFADIIYAHYPAEMSIYRGSVEDAVEYAATGARVCIPTTSSTLACDVEHWQQCGCPAKVHELQAEVVPAHRQLGILGTYTCTPQWLGFVPPKGSLIASVESSAIIYYNSVLGARTNRGGLFTRYAAVTGKYPLMGYLLDENRRGTHLFRLRLDRDDLQTEADYSALGFHVGGIVGSEVPVFDTLPAGTTQDQLLSLGAALATSGSVTLFHAPPHTAEAADVAAAFQGTTPRETHDVTRRDLDAVRERLTTIAAGGEVDFVTLGCPHYTLAQLRRAADWFTAHAAKVHTGVRLWICTNRMTKQAAAWEGLVDVLEQAGARIVCDTCPVECHMRTSTCKEHGLPTPQVRAMVADSSKMLRYVGDLIGCRTALRPFTDCLRAAVTGRLT